MSTVKHWVLPDVPSNGAIRGIPGVTLQRVHPVVTAGLLEAIGIGLVDQAGARIRYRVHGDRATVIGLPDRETPSGRTVRGPSITLR